MGETLKFTKSDARNAWGHQNSHSLRAGPRNCFRISMVYSGNPWENHPLPIPQGFPPGGNHGECEPENFPRVFPRGFPMSFPRGESRGLCAF